MSAASNSSNLSSSSTDVYEDEFSTWLQCPVDDEFERFYCSDLSVGWSPPPNECSGEISVIANTEGAGSLFDVRMSESTACGSSSSPTKKDVGSKSFLRSSSTSEDALAMGAARAAGLLPQVGLDAFSRVRTSMQPNATSQFSTPCSSLKAFHHKDCSLKPSIPVPYASKPPQGDVKSPRVNISTAFSMEKTEHPPASAISFAMERPRKVQETHLHQLSHTQQSGSSYITEEGSLGRGKVASSVGRMSEDPPSQTSMSLSFRETICGGKRKYDDSKLQSEDADDEVVNFKVPHKSSSRRNRVSEIHNLTERNRRNRINEKLKALQDLIPNSSKTDKASMLDEAIEYMKSLQIQLQMVSMRSGMNISPRMMPMTFLQTQTHAAPLHSVGIGLPVGHAGMGMGMGMTMDMGLVQQSVKGLPFQSSPPALTQYGMPFQSGNMASASLHDSSQACTSGDLLPATYPLDFIQKFPKDGKSD